MAEARTNSESANPEPTRASRRGMGRGLSAILPTTHTDLTHDELRQIPTGAIDVNPNQPRKSFEDDALNALADSIAANGVIQPLLVKPLAAGRYELVAGERRLRASKLAGIESVPAYVRADLTANTLELALVENMARVDLNPIDAARACAALVDDLGLTKEEVSKRVGKSRVAVSNLIRLLNLPDEVIQMVEDGMLSEGHGRALLRAGDHFTIRRLAHEAAADGWSVRETERRAEAAAESANPKAPVEGTAAGTEQAEAAEAAHEIAERFMKTFGIDPRVKVSDRGVKVTLDFASVDEALKAIAPENRR
ncbi:MAG: ParB/RepB/Spo0J family partition protein [Thermoleophilaceae bacterium]|nr:ParB/RepB/Spo0J family partition protein [Thermoleophilaceae bacterium]